MDIINPQITIRKSGWLSKFFSGEYTIVFTYAVEYETSQCRRCEERTRLEFVQKIKLRTTGSKVPVHDETVGE